MSKLTVAQLRERELERLVMIKTTNPSEEDYAEARRNMNSYYRLCGLCERNLYMQNDERAHSTRYAMECEKREGRWYERLNKTFKETYGIYLRTPGTSLLLFTKVIGLGASGLPPSTHTFMIESERRRDKCTQYSTGKRECL